MSTEQVGYVIIGRNEGQRLVRALASLPTERAGAVYVDSGSTDESVANAERAGAVVVRLDTSVPFTAARARNAGLAELRRAAPETAFVQFIDGDCEIVIGWIDAAVKALLVDNELAVVCGRRRERFPAASVYNRLCDLEWDTPVGTARACGGDAMIRVEAIRQAGGYNEQVIAGEEPELCYRLRHRGWGIRRIDHDMTLHDADMHRFGQWWKRMVRGGHAYAEAAWRHGREPERFGVRPSLGIWAWALVWPVAMIAFAWPTGGWSLAGALAYPLIAVKVARQQRRRGRTSADAWLYAGSCVIGKWPQWQGQLKFLVRKLRNKPAEIIEYKTSAEGSS